MPKIDSPADLYTQIKLGLVRVNQYSRPECRFWKKVNKEGPIHAVWGQCWVWIGSVQESGHGEFGDSNKVHRAHRWAYEEFVGQVPEGLCVLHRCDNPACVRPEHLFLGTRLDNSQDRNNKNRQAKGETCGSSKLTEEDVREIRRRYRRKSLDNNTYTLAKEFGVSDEVVRRVISGKTWKHVS